MAEDAKKQHDRLAATLFKHGVPFPAQIHGLIKIRYRMGRGEWYAQTVNGWWCDPDSKVWKVTLYGPD